MKHNNNILYIATILCLLSTAFFQGCVVDYEPENIEEVSDLLIIDGTITDNVSTFRLGRSVGLSDFLTGKETVDNATLYVESEDGEVIAGQFESQGVYNVPTGTLNEQTKYRLCLSVNGEDYQSSFLTPLITPEIDSISPEKRGKGETVYMCVSTHDPKNQSRYYRWSYKEHWEVKAELEANAGYEDGEVIWFNLATSTNTYYCWGQDTSRMVILDSSEKLSENVISQKRLLSMDPSSDRLSVLYYIAVEQMMLRKEAYDYFFNMQKNVEQTGSIFAPVPSEMKGNIRCITNPDLPVIGYIDVTTTTRKSLFVPEDAGIYEPPVKACYLQITKDPMMAPPTMGYYIYDPTGLDDYAPWECVDCRKKSRATKNKPDFWPNNHL